MVRKLAATIGKGDYESGKFWGLGFDENIGSHLAGIFKCDVHSHASAGKLRNAGVRRGAGKEYESQLLIVIHFGKLFSCDAVLGQQFLCDAFGVDAAAVVFGGDAKDAALGLRAQCDTSLGRFAGGGSALRRLDAVNGRVSYEM